MHFPLLVNSVSILPGCGRALTLGAAHVAQSDDVRVLGVQLSSDLSLDKHVNVLVLSASFNYDNYAASDVLLMTTLLLHSFMRSSQAESIIAAVSWLALRRRRPISCNVSSTRQNESSRTRASSTGDSLISGEVSYTGWTLSTGFGSESASRCSDVCTRWLLNTCRPTANRLRHFWSSPPAIGWLWSSRLPTCETCFVRRAFICICRPFKLELTSCSP